MPLKQRLAWIWEVVVTEGIKCHRTVAISGSGSDVWYWWIRWKEPT